MGTLRKVKGVYPLMDKGFRLLWYICMGEVQVLVLVLGFPDDGKPSKTIRPYQLLGKGGVAGHRNRHQTAGRISS